MTMFIVSDIAAGGLSGGDNESAEALASLSFSEPEMESSESDEENDESLQDFLRQWALKHGVALTSLTALLKGLSKFHPDIPLCAQTLLKTPTQLNVRQQSGMDCIDYPLNEKITQALQSLPDSKRLTLSTVELGVNIDGLSLFKSSKVVFWPVLCSIANVSPPVVFPLTLTCGTSKPTSLEFLEHFVKEVGKSVATGVEIDGAKKEVQLKFVVCDSPARSMVKGTKLCSGYNGCDKCNAKGQWVREGHGGKVVFNEQGCLRTDQSFRSRRDQNHHKVDSPLENLKIDMISNFPIDYMHQACLGVMRQLLFKWTRGPLSPARLSETHITVLNGKLAELKPHIPNVFARKPRSLNELERWKATEYRQFLLYSGKLVLKSILPKQQYKHFMLLSCAFCILVSRSLTSSYADVADSFLQTFLRQAPDIYGEGVIAYNMHALHFFTSSLMPKCTDASNTVLLFPSKTICTN